MNRLSLWLGLILTVVGCGTQPGSPSTDVERTAMLVGDWTQTVTFGLLTLTLSDDGTAHRSDGLDGTWKVENGLLELRLFTLDKGHFDGDNGEEGSVRGAFYVEKSFLLFPALLPASAGVYEGTHVYENDSLSCKTHVITTVTRRIELDGDNTSTLSTDAHSTTCYTNLPPSDLQVTYAAATADFDRRFEIVSFETETSPIADKLTVLDGTAASFSPVFTR